MGRFIGDLRNWAKRLVISSLFVCAISGCTNQAFDQPEWDTTLSLPASPTGQAWTKCGDSERPIRLHDPFVTLDDIMMGGCTSAGGSWVEIYYEGEIDAYFDRLMASASEYARMQAENGGNEGFLYTLNVSSPGGDVEAAIAAAERMGSARWSVKVTDSNDCNSSCVLVYAAGAKRHLGDGSRIGVHRLFPVNSSSKSVAELNEELTAIENRVRTLFRQNGVSTGLLDVMSGIPSNDIRYLTYQELEQLGLGSKNAAASDLFRLHVEKKCGADFEQQLSTFRSWMTRCLNPYASSSSHDASQACLVREAEQRGLLLAKCRHEFCDSLEGLCQPYGPVQRSTR